MQIDLDIIQNVTVLSFLQRVPIKIVVKPEEVKFSMPGGSGTT